MIGRIITRGWNSDLKCLCTGSLPLFPSLSSLFFPQQRACSQAMSWAELQKHLKIKGTRNYYFKTIGYCFRTKVKSPHILRRFLRRFYATWPWGADEFFQPPTLTNSVWKIYLKFNKSVFRGSWSKKAPAIENIPICVWYHQYLYHWTKKRIY